MRANQPHEKLAKRGLTAGLYFILAVIIFFAAPESAQCGSQNDKEEKAVLTAARNFLDAEVRGDYQAVYACFAPSSLYIATHSYEQYREQTRQLPDRIIAYRIIRVSHIQNQEDRKAYPTVDKIAQVEVEATFLHTPTQKRSEINIGFVFLKERGRWYKS